MKKMKKKLFQMTIGLWVLIFNSTPSLASDQSKNTHDIAPLTPISDPIVMQGNLSLEGKNFSPEQNHSLHDHSGSKFHHYPSSPVLMSGHGASHLLSAIRPEAQIPGWEDTDDSHPSYHVLSRSPAIERPGAPCMPVAFTAIRAGMAQAAAANNHPMLIPHSASSGSIIVNINIPAGEEISFLREANIILAEDNETIAFCTLAALNSMGLGLEGTGIVRVKSGTELISKVAAAVGTASEFQLIISDFEMDNDSNDGPKAALALREAGIKTPIIGYTSNKVQEMDQETINLYAGFLPKPFSVKKHYPVLKGIISEILHKSM
ncbi:MAG: response regulator [Oligoflexia bacterium]|nr:response regulator [Oligoflexia bacterium]